MSKYTLPGIFLSLSIITWIGAEAQDGDSILVVTSDQLDSYWTTEKKVAPNYPRQSLSKGEQGCVAVGFIIEPDGTTSSHHAVASFPSSNFDKSGIEAAKQFLYKPSDQNISKEAVFTTNTFTYEITTGRKRKDSPYETVGAACTKAAKKKLDTYASDADSG